MTSISAPSVRPAKTIPLGEASSEQLLEISSRGLLSLSLEEMQVIQRHFQNLRRDPTDVELETLAQTWSEHCVHKTFKARFGYSETASSRTFEKLGSRSYENLLKDTIAKATEELNPAWCLSVFRDNAGVIEFDQDDGVSFKVETHNHPSALEPYGGAGTGVGGVIRDVLGCGLGGKPVLNTDVFCFGQLDAQDADIPAGALSPKRIARGVVSGVRDYGNRMGIPTANGAIYFDEGYTGNPLVFCGTVGLMPKTCVEKEVRPGDWVVVMGGRTGRDGIHGATFSSAPLKSGITSSVVQIGHAIMEKKTLDVLLVARDKHLFRSITDCGAGGFSSAIGELGQATGVQVWLEKAPLKYPGLEPWEIWISESQERMILAVPPEHWNQLHALCEQENVEAVIIGKFTDDKKLDVQFNNETVALLDMDFLHDGLPKRELKGTWDIEAHERAFANNGKPAAAAPGDLLSTFKQLLQHPVVASKESVVRQYDHEVQGGSVIKPFMGPAQDGPTDACVFRPKLNSWKGVAVSNGLNPEMGKFDPYVMALWAIDEAYRNLIAVGGGLSHVAILDNFCWGDPQNPLELAGLVRAAEACRRTAEAYGLPFISGKDSFNNTWKANDGKLRSIPPTLVVSAIGVIEDVRRCLSPGLKTENNALYLVGETTPAMKGSLAAQLWALGDTPLPTINFEQSKAVFKKLQSAMKHRYVVSCHDVSDGGVAVAAAEMCFGSRFGVELDLTRQALPPEVLLFAESSSRFLVEVPSTHQLNFESLMDHHLVQQLGIVTKKPSMVVRRNDTCVINEPVAELKNLWKTPLRDL